MKTNYINFSDKQLILGIPKVYKTPFYQKLLSEMKIRIILGEFKLSLNDQVLLLKNSLESCLNDPLLRAYLTVNFETNFSEMDF